MISLRKFAPDDLGAYVSMSEDFYSGDSTLFPVDKKNFESTLDAVLRGIGGVEGFMIELDGEAVGYILTVSSWSCEAGGTNVLLDEIYLLPEFRGRGIGSEVMQKILAKYPDAKRFRLEVCPRNPRVKKLYERFGFEILDYIQMVKN